MLLNQEQEEKEIQDTFQGLLLGMVKKNYDKQHEGMVEVELLVGEKGKTTTDWIPVMQLYAGKQYGTYFQPEIGDIVIVGFLLGNMDSPVVLGSMWDKTNTLPTNCADNKNSIKRIITKCGHTIIFDEKKDNEKIEIVTKGKMSIVLEDKNDVICLKDSKGENVLKLDGKQGEITLEAKKKITLKAGTDTTVTIDGSGKKISMKAQNLQLEAKQALKAKGQSTNIEGSMIKMKSSGSFKAESSAMMELKGTMVKVN